MDVFKCFSQISSLQGRGLIVDEIRVCSLNAKVSQLHRNRTGFGRSDLESQSFLKS